MIFFNRQRLVLLLCVLFLLGSFSSAFASTTDGTIDSVNKYAWGENLGWINFGTIGGNVHITDTGLTGYAWSTNFGWINLSPTGGGVKNDGAGNLSGYAWSEQTGYINFSGVAINSSGVFTGTATGAIAGRISFDCTNCNVSTDYRPGSSATPAVTTSPSSGGGGGGSGYFATSTTPTPTENSTTSGSGGLSAVIVTLQNILNTLNPFKPAPIQQVGELQVPKVAPPALTGQWDLISSSAIGAFVLAPLPKELSLLTGKFSSLRQTFRELGVTGAASLPKLQGVELSLPALEHQNIPTEVVFARSSDDRIGLNVKLSLSASGEVQKHVNVVAGTTLKLVVRPESSARSVKGYLVLRSAGSSGAIGENNRSISMQAALTSMIFKSPQLANNVSGDMSNVEQKLALTAF